MSISSFKFSTQFQFTHPGGVRRAVPTTPAFRYRRFNSRTREGCDCLSALALSDMETVSIHAPGRGATWRTSVSSLPKKVSIHAPGRGATKSLRQCLHRRQVSIHAPGRGATYQYNGRSRRWHSFQFTHPGGVRHRFNPFRLLAYQFQFTHPGGVRHGRAA